jgi:hypothetical protein
MRRGECGGVNSDGLFELLELLDLMPFDVRCPPAVA